MQRLVDVLFALCCLILTFPLMLVIAWLLKREACGPILYIPAMVGQHGQIFPLLRFRTMAMDQHRNLQHPPQFTPVGQFIRTYSLDHLPMLFNLLIGDLTIIGPRPMEVAKVDRRDPIWQAYCAIKPGVLNYAVLVSGKQWTADQTAQPHRNQRLELAYAHQRSWWTDVRLFVRWLIAWIASGGNVKAGKAPDNDGTI